LVPNAKGLERALDAGVQRIALFTAASEAFTKKNINMTVRESIDTFAAMVKEFRSKVPGGWVRGYVSTAFECPYAGRIAPETTSDVARQLLDIGVDEVSLGDTIGAAAPPEVNSLSSVLGLAKDKVAWHFHDTRGTAIANVAAALDLGYFAFDSSAGGLGGCPYAPGAGGNLATEDLVYFLERCGLPTGVDLSKLAAASLPVLAAIGRRPGSRSQLAQLSASPCSG
jgi:hydroxymethylglutaryl-CoA lyase